MIFSKVKLLKIKCYKLNWKMDGVCWEFSFIIPIWPMTALCTLSKLRGLAPMERKFPSQVPGYS